MRIPPTPLSVRRKSRTLDLRHPSASECSTYGKYDSASPASGSSAKAQPCAAPFLPSLRFGRNGLPWLPRARTACACLALAFASAVQAWPSGLPGRPFAARVARSRPPAPPSSAGRLCAPGVTDPYGRLTSRTGAKGQKTAYSYDPVTNQLTTMTCTRADGTPKGTVAFTYLGDRVGTVVDTANPPPGTANYTYRYEYDPRHRLTKVTSPTGTVNYGYVSDSDDKVLSADDGSGRAWAYAYYPDGSLAAITAPEGQYVYQYNEVGQVSSVSYPPGGGAGPAATYVYDWQHRPMLVQNAFTPSPGGATRQLSLYTYGDDQGTGPDGKGMAGMITQVTEDFKHTDQNFYGPYTANYGYDENYQLTRVAYPAYAPALNVPWSNQTHTFTYDPAGNRLTYQKKDNTTQAILDNAVYAYLPAPGGTAGPQLGTVTHTGGEPSTSFTYDPNGNLSTQVVNSTPPVTATYTWDQNDKLAGLSTSDNSVTANYVYAYNGDRLQRTLNGTKWEYLYSKEDILRIDPSPSTLGPSLYLTQGPGIDDVLAEFTNPATPQYAFKNMLSSVTQLTNANPNPSVVEAHAYSAWGESTSWPTPGTNNSVYGYTGREWDVPGQFFYRNRLYRPDIGRFLSRDPIVNKLWLLSRIWNEAPEAITRPYSYAGLTPTKFVGPFGLQSAGAGSGRGGSCCCDKIKDRFKWINDEIIPSLVLKGTWPPSVTGIGGSFSCGGEMPRGAGINVPIKDPCITPCIRQHEEKHRQMCNGLGVAYANLDLAGAEIPALNEESECLHLFCKAKGCEGCP